MRNKYGIMSAENQLREGKPLSYINSLREVVGQTPILNDADKSALFSYIVKQIKKNVSKSEIIRKLSHAGWSHFAIQYGFELYAKAVDTSKTDASDYTDSDDLLLMERKIFAQLQSIQKHDEQIYHEGLKHKLNATHFYSKMKKKMLLDDHKTQTSPPHPVRQPYYGTGVQNQNANSQQPLRNTNSSPVLGNNIENKGFENKFNSDSHIDFSIKDDVDLSKLTSQFKNKKKDAQSSKQSSSISQTSTASNIEELDKKMVNIQTSAFTANPFGYYNPTKIEDLEYTEKTESNRVATGILDLDLVIEGGIPRNNTVLISGGAGTGKSTFALQFLINGAVRFSEPGIYITFEQTKDAIFSLSEQFSWDAKNLEEQSVFSVLEYTPEQLYKAMQAGGGSLRDMIESMRVKRIVIDSITDFIMLFKSETNQRKEIVDLFKKFSKWGVTVLVVGEEDSEQKKHFSTVLDYECDGVILLYNERRGDIRHRALEIFKMRETKHAGRIFPMKISEKGVIVSVKDKMVQLK